MVSSTLTHTDARAQLDQLQTGGIQTLAPLALGLVLLMLRIYLRARARMLLALK